MGANRLAVAAVLAAGLAGCSGGGGSGPDGAVSPAGAATASAGAPPGKVIPDGTWAKTTTAADAAALGLPPDVAALGLGPDGRTRIELRIAGTDLAQFSEDVDDEGMVLGDRGTFRYDDRCRWVLTSLSEGCPGCTAAFVWSVDGDRLTLRLDEIDSSEDPMEVLVARSVMEGTFTRQ